jgi:hypothetical protein
MKWIKLFENNTEIGRNLAKNLIKDLEIDYIIEDIDECVSEIVDTSISEISREQSGTWDTIYLKYKRGNRNYTTVISIEYYLKSDLLDKKDINYFNKFVELFNLSTKSEFVSIVSLQVKSGSLESVRKSLKSFMKRVSNMGYDIKVLSKYGINMKRSDPNRYQDIDGFLGSSNFLQFEISADIDISKLKTEVDKSPIPDRLINRYDEFIQKWRIPTEGQKELISWFSDN